MGRGLYIRIPSGIWIHPTVWPQYTNATDRQTGQLSRMGEPLLVTVSRPKITQIMQKKHEFYEF